MHTLIKPVATSLPASLLVLLLASCGGQTPEAPAQPQLAASTVHRASAQAAVPADYHQVVQSVYVAYFGRPADPGGLAFFATNYMNAGAPTNIVEVSAAYGSNPAITALIDSFGTSQESQDLYPGDNVTFVTAIYQNLFSRAPDTGGRDFWVGNLDAGRMTRAQAAVAIMAGSQGTDTTLINKKVAVASAFTTGLDTDLERSAYSGLAANVVVRTALGTVSIASDISADGVAMRNAVASLMFPSVENIVRARCVGCHSSRPTIPGFNPAPLGIRYDTTSQIENDDARIAAVVAGFSMPYGNMTGMTEQERTVIAGWYANRP